jgi:vacuolar-type H+-ATPase subunit D/Vma8
VTQSHADKIAALKKKKQQLAARLQTLEAQAKGADRKRDARRKIIVGGAVLAHAALHPAFGKELASILSVAVTRPQDRQAIADLLGG